MAKKISIFLIAVLAFGCEKVIDIDLNDASPKIVIEAVIGNSPGLHSVKITRTGSYFEEYEPEMVQEAEVAITDTLGNKFLFAETEPGIYQTERFFPAFFREYQLLVKVGGEEYTAVSKLFPPVKIASSGSEYVEGFIFSGDGYVARFSFLDPAMYDNYYRLNISGSPDLDGDGDKYYLFSDEFYNGKPIDITLQNRLYNPGDTVVLELETIDKPAYIYLSTLQEIVSGNSVGSAAPANPVSNFTNDALGYFSIYSSSCDTVIITDTE